MKNLTYMLKQPAIVLYWIYILGTTDRKTLCHKLHSGQRRVHEVVYLLAELDLIHIGYYKNWKHQYVLTEKGKIIAEKITKVLNGITTDNS